MRGPLFVAVASVLSLLGCRPGGPGAPSGHLLAYVSNEKAKTVTIRDFINLLVMRLLDSLERSPDMPASFARKLKA